MIGAIDEAKEQGESRMPETARSESTTVAAGDAA